MSKKAENYIPWSQRGWNAVLVIVSGLVGGFVGVAMALSMFAVSSKKFFLDAADKHGISERTSSRLGGPVIFLGAILLGCVQFLAQDSSVFLSNIIFLRTFQDI